MCLQICRRNRPRSLHRIKNRNMSQLHARSCNMRPTNDQDHMQKRDGDLIAYFMRHLVPIFFTFTKGSTSYSAAITSFVMSIADQWFLVTAGHCLKQIADNITIHGYKITNCLLVDSLGIDAKHIEPIPFNYESSHPTHIIDDANFDYGFMILSPYYRRLLEKNNIQPLDEEVWKRQPSSVDFYAIIGMANELTTVTSESLETTPSLHRIIPLDNRPAIFPKTDIPLFYGRIVLGNALTSIKGMSGGPIFAFRQNAQGQLRYWLAALQSSWSPQTHYIVACPTKLLGDTLESILLKHRDSQN